MYIIVVKPLDDTPPVAKFVGIIDSRWKKLNCSQWYI
jgi:hypothetical protein